MTEPKSVIKVVWNNYLPELSYMTTFPNSRYLPPKVLHFMRSLHFVCPLCHASHLLYEYLWLLLLFLVIFSTSLSGSDDFVLSTQWTEMLIYSQMFYAIFPFCAQFKFETNDLACHLKSTTLNEME